MKSLWVKTQYICSETSSMNYSFSRPKYDKSEKLMANICLADFIKSVMMNPEGKSARMVPPPEKITKGLVVFIYTCVSVIHSS